MHTTSVSTPQGIALYIGALLGPSLLLLPGLAAATAGPASVVSWLAMLALSGLLAFVFVALGSRYPSDGGVAGYVAVAFGRRWGAAVSWCFLAGVITGAPVVCLIGGNYLAAAFGGGESAALVAAGGLLAVVLLVTAGGARVAAGVQLALVAVLVLVVAFAVVAALPHAEGRNWVPFAPHGSPAIGTAASQLMLSFVGWESVAAVTNRLRDPARQLPRVIGIAFAATSVIYLALSATSIAVLGAGAGADVAVSSLLRVSIGGAAPLVAAVTAVALTLAATNAYITGGIALVEARSRRGSRSAARIVPAGIALVGAALFGARALGLAGIAQLVSVPTALFLAVYFAATLAAIRMLAGRGRAAAVLATGGVLVVVIFTGWSMLIAAAVAAVALLADRRTADGSRVDPHRQPRIPTDR